MKNSAGNSGYVGKGSAQPWVGKCFFRHGKTSPPSEASAFDYAHILAEKSESQFFNRDVLRAVQKSMRRILEMSLARGRGRELESRFEFEDQNVHEEENEAKRAWKTRRKDQSLYHARPHPPEDSGNSKADSPGFSRRTAAVGRCAEGRGLFLVRSRARNSRRSLPGFYRCVELREGYENFRPGAAHQGSGCEYRRPHRDCRRRYSGHRHDAAIPPAHPPTAQAKKTPRRSLAR